MSSSLRLWHRTLLLLCTTTSLLPAQRTPVDAIRWLEGRWHGSGGSWSAFFEEYAVLNDSTIEQREFGVDSTFNRMSGSSRIEWRAGQWRKTRDGRVQSTITGMTRDSLRFSSADGRTGFSWVRTAGGGWRAILHGGTGPIVYEMRRVQTAAPAGAVLLRAINAAHRDRWFRSLTFVQRTVFPGPVPREETWYETMIRPGFLRIDVEREGAMVGRMLFRNDSLYQFAAGGRLAAARPIVHELLLLLHDVHVGDVEQVIARLQSRGFDLGATGRATWDGRAVTIVGATEGDSTKRQFWLDMERQVVVRVLAPRPAGGLSDTRIGEYHAVGGGQLEHRIRFFTGEQETMDERYVWVRAGETIPMSDFDPQQSALPAWIARYRASSSDKRPSPPR